MSQDLRYFSDAHSGVCVLPLSVCVCVCEYAVLMCGNFSFRQFRGCVIIPALAAALVDFNDHRIVLVVSVYRIRCKNSGIKSIAVDVGPHVCAHSIRDGTQIVRLETCIR